jgi:hypothetical protein
MIGIGGKGDRRRAGFWDLKNTPLTQGRPNFEFAPPGETFMLRIMDL